MLYFFLSYAREDDPEYIRRFFQDLSSQVRNLAGVGKADAVGFLDEQNVQIGQRWSSELADALGTCSCFVAMTSPRYFRRDYCGREWYVFNDRLAAYERQWSRRAPALLPVRWIPSVPMHPVAAEIQGAHAAIAGRSYLEYGLRQLLDLKRFRDDYRTFVFELARRIVSVADGHKVPRARGQLRLDQVPNVFTDASPPRSSSRSTAAGRRAAARRRSPRAYVHFIVVAGTRDEMSTVRDKLDYYGGSAEEWAPYRSDLEDALARYATQVADGRLFDSEVGDIRRLAERLDQATRQNEMVVLLVDAWATNLPEHQRALSSYDGRQELTSAVMIPFNGSDAETLADTTVLQAQLAQALPRILQRRDRIMLRQNIPTPEQFGTDLEEILEVAQNRIFKRGTVNPQVPERPSHGRPILEGPTSTMDGTRP